MYNDFRDSDILYASAEDGGYVDPHKIEKILKIPNTTKSATTSASIKEETITGS